MQYYLLTTSIKYAISLIIAKLVSFCILFQYLEVFLERGTARLDDKGGAQSFDGRGMGAGGRELNARDVAMNVKSGREPSLSQSLARLRPALRRAVLNEVGDRGCEAFSDLLMNCCVLPRTAQPTKNIVVPMRLPATSTIVCHQEAPSLQASKQASKPRK